MFPPDDAWHRPTWAEVLAAAKAAASPSSSVNTERANDAHSATEADSESDDSSSLQTVADSASEARRQQEFNEALRRTRERQRFIELQRSAPRPATPASSEPEFIEQRPRRINLKD